MVFFSQSYTMPLNCSLASQAILAIDFMLLNTKQEEKMPFENGVIYIKIDSWDYPNLEIDLRRLKSRNVVLSSGIRHFTKNLKSRDVKGFVQVEHMIKL